MHGCFSVSWTLDFQLPRCFFDDDPDISTSNNLGDRARRVLSNESPGSSSTPTVFVMDSAPSTVSLSTGLELKEKGSLSPSIKTMDSEKKTVQLPTPAVFEPEYPTGLRLGLLLFALAISVFLVALDNTIIATAVVSSLFLPCCLLSL